MTSWATGKQKIQNIFDLPISRNKPSGIEFALVKRQFEELKYKTTKKFLLFSWQPQK